MSLFSKKPKVIHEWQYMPYGFQPEHRSKALENLIWGKTYRDLQITEWQDGVRHGYLTKYEIIQSVPKWMRAWVASKLRKVPYDEDYDMSRMLIKMYQNGNR